MPIGKHWMQCLTMHRVKELKSSSVTDLTEDKMDASNEDLDFEDESDQDFLLDQEFPPENLHMSEDEPEPKKTRKTPQHMLDQSESLIQRHRQHIREMTEISKMESKLLVNFTMKLSSEMSANAQSGFEGYLNQLESIMDSKMRAIQELKKEMKRIARE
jgi:LPS O-antigen subunit length determinant protein (WzzB/FepE family)